jgi:membrane-associated phospholipid phosphatase
MNVQMLKAQTNIQANSSHNEDNKPRDYKPTLGEYIVQDFGIAWHDAGRYFASPLRATPQDWTLTAGAASTTFILLTVDEPVNNLMLTGRTSLLDRIAEAGRNYGGYPGMVLGGVLYVSGLLAEHNELRTTGRLVLQALAYSGITTTLLKSAFGRSRPYHTTSAFDFQPLHCCDDALLSLPSGHATVAFAVSSVLAERIAHPWASVGLYSLAAITVWSRMYHTMHWSSDVLLGSIIGLTAGLAVCRWEQERSQSSSSSLLPHTTPHIFIQPDIHTHWFGVMHGLASGAVRTGLRLIYTFPPTALPSP